MARYIELDALVAEIEKAIEIIYAGRKYVGIPYSEECIVRGLQKAEDIINSFKVKEVDIEKEIKECINDEWCDEWSGDVGNWIRCRRGTTSMEVEDVEEIAKHFFKLGLNASNPLTWEDIKLIWTIGDEIPYMPEEDFFKELLKRFKAQEGEEL